VRVFIAMAAVSISCATAAWGYQPVVNYQLRCMGCHLADGSGQPGRVPSIRRSLALFSTSFEGRAYVVRVPGVAQSPLSDEETATLLNWMVKNLSDLKVPRGFVDYSATEIHGLRGQPLVEVSALRARLWKAATAKPRLQ
jgi:hypothetical protein